MQLFAMSYCIKKNNYCTSCKRWRSKYEKIIRTEKFLTLQRARHWADKNAINILKVIYFCICIGFMASRIQQQIPGVAIQHCSVTERLECLTQNYCVIYLFIFPYTCYKMLLPILYILKTFYLSKD